MIASLPLSLRHRWGGLMLAAALLVMAPGLHGGFPSAAFASPPDPVPGVCKRPAAGTSIKQPAERESRDGVLRLSLTLYGWRGDNGAMSYCYVDERGNEAPTLRVSPGDVLEISLRNRVSMPGAPAQPAASKATRPNEPNPDPCAGGTMSAASTNLHFHGLALPPVCHQDETLRTLIQPGDPPFEYRVRIPRDQPPGLYWYHPHVHGFSEEQLLGGASGALIVEGIGAAVASAKGLPERVLLIRDESMPATPATAAPASDPNKPTKQLSVNYVPVPYPQYPTAVIKMKPGSRELWRVVNASADTYVNLSLQVGGQRRNVGLVAMDGVPLRLGEGAAGGYVPDVSFIFLPPAGRAEFILTGPPAGETGTIMTGFVDRGADEDAPPGAKTAPQPGMRIGQDDIDAARPLISITASQGATEPGIAGSTPAIAASASPPLSSVRPIRKRTLYFSERLAVPGDASSATLFFITLEGQEPRIFDPDREEPNITVHVGDVEDWIIENRSRETHTFHIHQLHFVVVGRRSSGAWEEPSLRDTVNVAAWKGYGPYPSVTLRMDFRNPQLVGTLPFHCHIAQHLDGGMMGTVRIEPAPGQ